MTVFAVEYVYDAATAAVRDEFRPAHRAWLGSLAEEGTVLASGPVDSGAGALLIMVAEDQPALDGLLREDPFQINGAVAQTSAREWSPVIGRFSEFVS
ncbi:uncharacterized protein YciI [Arthrobacter woluwensis]|uniref:YciI family protein n=1 Tax=Arthrobacter woluwensis TaxID=156980 RepID=UPI00277F92FF|nr:YciI family protein [Arthrobacter woluwensis]MDQ0708227.1 uncharacterized protein YciI [Arthrobacter woluwensis]